MFTDLSRIRSVSLAGFILLLVAFSARAGSAQSAFTANPTSLDFGSAQVGTSVGPVTVTVSTNGHNMSGFQINGTNKGDFSVSGTPGAGVFLVTFTPQGAGTRTATLGFGDPMGYPLFVPLTGIGTPPPGETPPAAPSGLKLLGYSYNKVTLGWTDNSNNETAFEIYRKSGSGAYSLVGVVAPNTTAYRDTTVSPSTSYTYEVRSANNTYASAYTNTVDVTTIVGPPAAPTSLTAMTVGYGKIALHWTDNSSNETAFEVYRAVGFGSFALIAVLWPNSTGYTDYTAAGSTAYIYEVRAANDYWASGFSNQVGITTAFPPTAPTGLTATAISSTQINLAWTDNSSNETAFEVYRAIGAGAYVLAAVLAPNTTAYADKSAVAHTSYSYRVRAANDYWASAYTNVSSASTP